MFEFISILSWSSFFLLSWLLLSRAYQPTGATMTILAVFLVLGVLTTLLHYAEKEDEDDKPSK